jgi:multidrug efflux pump subunit AcrB
MKAFFERITSLSMRFRFVTLAISVLIAALGFVGVSQLQLELIPSIAFPQTVILAQVSGMSSDEVLNIITIPLENELAKIPEIVNVETTTTGAFGAVIIARNEFGIDQTQLQENIQLAINRVWLPVRRLGFGADEDAKSFALNRLADLSPEILIYLQEEDPNFLFQLVPEVWEALSPETVQTLVAYLASQTTATVVTQSPLQRIVDLDIIPQIESLSVVADVTVSGGQLLPNEDNGMLTATTVDTSAQETNLVFELSPEVWEIVLRKVPNLGERENAILVLVSVDFTIPVEAPQLPMSWQMDHFLDANDLSEMRSPTRTIASVFNKFYETGEIVGPLGQTNDLSPATVTRILEIAPSMVSYFEPRHLAAVSEEVFAALPADYLASLDGFARDELAAASIAGSVTGVDLEAVPIELPNAWRISAPQLISFSFDDLPLATFSISGTDVTISENGSSSPSVNPNSEDSANPETITPTAIPDNLPEGPALPLIFSLIGEPLGLELNTADDLISIEIPADLAELTGSENLEAADFLNLLTLLSDPSALAATEGTGFSMDSSDIAAFLPALQECNINVLAVRSPDFNFAEGLIACLSADVIAYLAEHDPSFVANLQPDVFNYFSDEVLFLEAVTPPLPDEWDTLAQQPEFSAISLDTAQDILNLGSGQASVVLNGINLSVPAEFAGYEVRLFNSLPPSILRYFALHEADFYSHLDTEVLRKLSPEALSTIPAVVLDTLDSALSAELRAIASGEQASAFTELSSLYQTEIPAADPNAPAINSDWGQVGAFYGIELDTADDFFRFPADFRFATPAEFMNGIFDSPRGRAFAPSLFGGLSLEAIRYMLERDPQFFDAVLLDGLRLLQPDVLISLPEPLQERVASGGEVFTPSDPVTRTNGQASLQLTIFKSSDANTVTAFHELDALLTEIDTANETIEINVVFEQASFIEESIDGVSREGGLGGVFAILMILIFLSAGLWQSSQRRLTGVLLIVLSSILLAIAIFLHLGANSADIWQAFISLNILIQVPGVLGLFAGLVFVLWPGPLPYPAWRSTLVTAVSIPLSILMAFAIMRWLPQAVHSWLQPYANVAFLQVVLRLFPESISLNIMTLSGLTVAIGRVVDDSIVVLENVFRELQDETVDKQTAIIKGTRDVSVAIFAATVITVVVFIPLGLTGGIIGEFFLPFGLAVTYSLLSSFLVAITVVPVLVYLIVRRTDIHEESEEGFLERIYLPILRWSLKSIVNRSLVLVLAVASMIFGFSLLASRPAAFLPDFGKPQISITVNMPNGTPISETNRLVMEMERYIDSSIPKEGIEAIETIVGSGGLSLESLLGLGSGVSENIAEITIGIESQELLESYTQQLRTEAEHIFGEGNVTVSAASIAAQGFGSFSLVLSGQREDLEALDATVMETLNGVTGLSNVSSSLSQVGGASADGPVTYLRVDGETAVSYSAELESEDSLNVIQAGKEAVLAIPNLPETISISEGFETEVQTQGFASLFVAMGIALVIVVLILILTFGSVVHWLDIMLSIVVTPVGAAIALSLTDRALGISALIGMLMLIGIVVTNAVVLIDRVMSNVSERGLNTKDALIEAGGRRLRPILMTAFATIFALLPLAIGLSEGAIIASELGTVVIGGLLSSTLLTLIVVPVAYSFLQPLHVWISTKFKRSSASH